MKTEICPLAQKNPVYISSFQAINGISEGVEQGLPVWRPALPGDKSKLT